MWSKWSFLLIVLIYKLSYSSHVQICQYFIILEKWRIELRGKTSEMGSILFDFLKLSPLTVTDISLCIDTYDDQSRNQ